MQSWQDDFFLSFQEFDLCNFKDVLLVYMDIYAIIHKYNVSTDNLMHILL